MKIRADFAERVVVRPDAEAFVASPRPGVDRLMLDRIGEEIARATSLVRFAPGSDFPFHVHGGGEEVFILDGVFEDEHGRYPAGTYLRDPVGTAHAPFTKEGCTLFVKLWQFLPGDTTRKVIDTTCEVFAPTDVAGLERQRLHEFGGVSVAIERLAPGCFATRRLHAGGVEIFVLDGEFSDASGAYPKGSWIRDPGGVDIVSREGCRLLVTTGHLAQIVVPA
jgi:anti-sigma factor ChrR (cupin superfamily)